MAVSNQFRIKDIPRSKFSNKQVFDIIRLNSQVISES